MTPSSELTRAEKRFRRIGVKAVKELFDAKDPRVRRKLLKGDWWLEPEKPRKRRKKNPRKAKKR